VDSGDGAKELVISYMSLRKIVGWIGILLPIVLYAGNAIVFSAGRPDSMSGYYYTPMRNVFVGTLCALGVFLVAYEGYDNIERWVTNVAGFAAIGVALCPTKPPVAQLSTAQQVVGDVHLFFAAATFLALAFMAIRFAAPEGSPPAAPGPVSRAIYLGCGSTIFACVALAAASNLLPASVTASWPLLFIFEAVAVFAFGVSWFVKGEAMTGFFSRTQQAHASLTRHGQRVSP
jgi:hypothetical protein